MVLKKRIGRMFKKEFLKYIAIMIITILGMALVVAYGNTSFATKETMNHYWKRTNVEDGEFTTHVELTKDNISKINDKGFNVQKTFYFDIKNNDTTYRIFKSRKKINKEDIQNGSSESVSSDEVRLEKMYMDDNNVAINDDITIDGKSFTVKASIIVPDYCHRVAEISDVGTDKKFALVFVDDRTYDSLLKGREADEVYNYTYTVESGDLHDKQVELYNYLIDLPVDKENIKDEYVKNKIDNINHIKQKFIDGFVGIQYVSDKIADNIQKINESMGGNSGELNNLVNGEKTISKKLGEMKDSTKDTLDELLHWKYPNLYSFNNADSNTRVDDFVQCHQMYFSIALILGVLIAILIAYIISVFATSTIKKDRKIIGILYAMGYRRKELLKCYMIIPSIVVAIGAVIGTFLGFTMTNLCITPNYSRPNIVITYPVIFVVYGIVMPIVMTIFINYFVINRKLNHSALEIMQNRISDKTKLSDKNIIKSTKNKNFIKIFSKNQYKKGIKSHLILFFGLAVSILIMMLGIALYGSITHYADAIGDDTNFKYMYFLTNPTHDKPNNSEIAYSKYFDMYCNMSGSDMPVVIQGVEKYSSYFDFADDLTTDKNMIYVSDSAAVKFGYKKGDKIIFIDKLNKKDYVFTVAGQVSYKNGLYFFMNIDSMRNYFDADDNYYNTLLSDSKLNINPNMLISVTNKKTIVDTAKTWVKDTMGTIGMFVVLAMVIFVLVTFILIKNILEGSVYQISLLKIIGYRQKELNKIYLNTSFITVLISIIIMFPVGTILMKSLIPMVNASMKSGMASYISGFSYLFMAGLIILSYVAAYLLLQRKMRKIDTNEILKDRE